MTPWRIQRSRARGWRMPEGAVYVGRPTRWGNPFRAGGHDRRTGCMMSPSDVVEKYCNALVSANLEFNEAEVIRHLRGKDLVCWCAPGAPCHADVLLEIANGPVCEGCR